uniref:Uncharacterized protein n=1 Tax=Bathycoccus sp. RCC716 virus 2 TaxID=2530039 RepID=A0A7S6NYK5_9PHYC|nr:hypothetical protein [Bathycoccus sp. RCC716 virus 2]
MPGCNTGRNVQKYKGGGGGSASTLQEALENSNVASINIELINGAKYIGDGSLLTNIPGVGGSVGTLQQVTTAGDSTNKTTNFTNSVTAIKTTGNVFVGAGLYGTSNVTANIFYGDGGCLANTAATAGLLEITNTGNATTQVVSFNHGTTSLTAASNVRVVGNVYATGFNGGGYHVTGLDAAKIDHGTLPVVRGGTGVTSSTGSGNLVLSAGPTLSGTITGGTFSGSHSGDGSALTHLNLGESNNTGTVPITRGGTGTNTLNNLITLGTHTTGDYVQSITGGNGITSGGASEGGTPTVAVDPKTSGGLVFESNQLAVDLGASSITGTLAVADGGTGTNTLNNLITLGTHTTGNYVQSITGGNGITSGGASEGGTPTVAVDPKSSGGLVFESNQLAVDLGASSITGTLAVADGGTGTNTLNNLITMGTHTTGDYVSTITGGDGIQSTGGTSGENVGHTLSLDLKSNHGLAIDSGELKVDLKSNGGLAFESGQLALKLNDQSITGDLGAGKGGTGITSYSTGDILYASGGSTLSKLVSNSTTSGWFLKCVSGSAPQWADVSQVGSSNQYAHLPGADITGGNYDGSTQGITWSVESDAAATANKIVKRDSSGKITATSFIGSVADFNAGRLDTARLPTIPESLGGTGATATTGTGNNVLSNGPTFTGTVTVSGTGGTFSGSHTGNGSGLTHLNLGDANNTGQVDVARGGTGATTTTGGGTGAKNVLSISPTFTGTISGGTFDGSHTGNGSGLTHLDLGDTTNTGQVAVARGGTGATTKTGTGDNVLSNGPTFQGTVTVSGTGSKFAGSGASLTNLPTDQFGSSTIGVGNGGTGQSGFTAKSVLIGGSSTQLSTVAPLNGTNQEQYLRFSTDGSGNQSIGWATVSSTGSGVNATEITNDPSCNIAFVKDGANSTSVHMDNKLKYDSQKGSLYTSNIVTSDTTSTGLNGISNTTSTHTLSVGTVVSIQETSTGDVLIVRGNGYFNDDVYIAKKLTMPSGSTLVADTIKVRSHNVKETMVIAERPASQIAF